MSIIYEALKKVESSQSQAAAQTGTPQPDKRPKSRRRTYLLFVLAMLAGLFAANLLYEWLTPKPAAETTAKRETSPEIPEAPTPPPGPAVEELSETAELSPSSFMLNGIVYSPGGDSYALINNRVVKTGDKVGGATVLEISVDQVDLDLGGSVVKLLNTAK